jgi:hypothetical protein
MKGLPRPQRGWSFSFSPQATSLWGDYGLADLIISCIVRKCNRTRTSESANQQKKRHVATPRLSSRRSLSGDHVHVGVCSGGGDGDGTDAASPFSIGLVPRPLPLPRSLTPSVLDTRPTFRTHEIPIRVLWSRGCSRFFAPKPA